jgi:hypothetical protein
VSMGVRLFPAVHGHIADSVRDHGPGSVAHLGGSLGGGEAEAGGSPNRWFLDFDGLPSSVKNPPGSGKITGGTRVWPTHGPRDPRAVARTLLISGYRFGLTTPGSRPSLPGWRMGTVRVTKPAASRKVSAQLAQVSAVGCQNSCRASDLVFYSQHSCSFASSICSWSGCSAG